jgi:hypothetical protein
MPFLGSVQWPKTGQFDDHDLYFEVNLPSPPRYHAWLRDHLTERVPTA